MSEKTEDEKDFDWGSSEGIVMKTAAGIAVYTNPHGDVVIRQDRMDDSFWERDPFIVIPCHRVSDVIAALQKESEGPNG